jgi:hypothetical protein
MPKNIKYLPFGALPIKLFPTFVRFVENVDIKTTKYG